jgi:cytochrome d ubiquinol oxidase subunit I
VIPPHQVAAVNHAAFLLARGQFAFTIAFHICLAAFSIGLANYLVFLEARWLWTKDHVYIDTYNYWLKVLAINFTVGSVTGVVMEYQFGLDWGGFTSRVGGIIGPLMSYEVMIAFFLEAGFIGILLFGMKRVGPKVHFFATCMTGLGSLFSAFFILSANSWMQTPAGYAINAQGDFVPKDWWAIIFNPSFPYRFVHMVSAAFVVTSLFVAAVGAWHLLHNKNDRSARLMFSSALWMLVFFAPFQVGSGDHQGDNTLVYQPQKVAAMEGDWKTPKPGSGEHLVLFAIPHPAQERNGFTIAIPKIASIYLRHELGNGIIKGLRDFPRQDIPPEPVVFFAFRIMAGLGFLIWGASWMQLWLRWRRRLYDARWYLKGMVAMGPTGFIAMVAGWVVAEVGRQPYTVYGLLRTSQSMSPITLSGMITSFSLIIAIYIPLYGLGLFYVIRLLSKPPQRGQKGPEPDLADAIETPRVLASQGAE